MAVVKFKNEEGNFVALPIGGGLNMSWTGVTGKPFTSLDSDTLSVDDDGKLKVIGGNSGDSGISDTDFEAAFTEVFGE